jgi:4-diphosphocytidyl-2-C-methyl-D-erythritol kinase
VTDGVLRIRSFAKVNLALAVLGRRGDGYHDIETVFQGICLRDDGTRRVLSDEIEFHPAPPPAEAAGRIELACEEMPGVAPEDNLVWKAAAALRAQAPAGVAGVRIVLRKRIPSGAGLGGGSGDAAATLLGLRRFWGLAVTDAALQGIAEGLGSDVPFFLAGGTALGTGRGERLVALPDRPAEHLVVVFPGVEVSTATAYRALNRGNLPLTSGGLDPRIQRFLDSAKDGGSSPAGFFNDFETVILPAHPEIAEAKSLLDRLGAAATLLSGSGSSVFGFFSDEESACAASRSVKAVRGANWRAFPAETLARSEYLHRMFG